MKECKMSKVGWPLGRYRHRIGATWQPYAAGLCERIYKRTDGLKREDVDYLLTSVEGWVDVFVTARLSMERFGELRAFVDGYNAGLNV